MNDFSSQAINNATERTDADANEVPLVRKAYIALQTLVKHCDGANLQGPLEKIMEVIHTRLQKETQSMSNDTG